jgi:hypothetical protein
MTTGPFWPVPVAVVAETGGISGGVTGTMGSRDIGTVLLDALLACGELDALKSDPTSLAKSAKSTSKVPAMKIVKSLKAHLVTNEITRKRLVRRATETIIYWTFLCSAFSADSNPVRSPHTILRKPRRPCQILNILQIMINANIPSRLIRMSHSVGLL